MIYIHIHTQIVSGFSRVKKSRQFFKKKQKKTLSCSLKEYNPFVNQQCSNKKAASNFFIVSSSSDLITDRFAERLQNLTLLYQDRAFFVKFRSPCHLHNWKAKNKTTKKLYSQDPITNSTYCLSEFS